MAELPRGPGSSYFLDNTDTDRLGLVACGRLVGGRGERTGTFSIVAPVLETVPIVHGGRDDLILSAKIIRIAPESSSF